MNAIIQEKLRNLEQLCRKHRVARLHLFGSAARGDFDPEASDLDFLVEFQPMKPVEHADSYFGLLEDLGKLFKRHIDLLEPAPIVNPYLRKSIEESRRVVYEAAA